MLFFSSDNVFTIFEMRSYKGLNENCSSEYGKELLVVREVIKEYLHNLVTDWIQWGNGRIRDISLSNWENKNGGVSSEE